MKKGKGIIIPDILNAAGRKVLLHSCCAPCSSAILEFFLENDILPTVYYCNSNIYPYEEYQHRRNEIKHFLQTTGVNFIEDNYNHQEWLLYIQGKENEPERGARCLECFKFRLKRTAEYAIKNGFKVITTTLASSRWKNLEQINLAGKLVVEEVCNTGDLWFWDQNWRKGGLQDRRNALLKEYAFYNQQYCGCEFCVKTPKTSPNSEVSL